MKERHRVKNLKETGRCIIRHRLLRSQRQALLKLTFAARFARENDRNRLRCVYSLFEAPELYRMDPGNANCLKHKPKIKLTKTGF